MKHRILTFFAGLLFGAVLFGGATAIAAGITAEPAWSPIYVDGRQVQMTVYNILGNNYVKLRDIGKAVGFNVYYDAGVQVDSGAPYTGEAPAKADPQPVTALQGTLQARSMKGTELKGRTVLQFPAIRRSPRWSRSPDIGSLRLRLPAPPRLPSPGPPENPGRWTLR